MFYLKMIHSKRLKLLRHHHNRNIYVQSKNIDPFLIINLYLNIL